MNGLDLFSGIAGISVALEPWVRTVAYCEQDRYAQSVLLSRMASNDIERAPIWDDVTSLRASMLPEIDIIFGGFPCQDISVAGNGAGLAGKRSGLFFEIIRLTKETSPSFVFLENVPAIRTRGLREVVRAFTEIGYDCRWTCLSASSIGAPHKRERWFLLAHAKGANGDNESRATRTSESWKTEHRFPEHLCNDVSDANGRGQQMWRPRGDENKIGKRTFDVDGLSACFNELHWASEPNVGRVVNGLPMRVDRIKCLGNSVVPAQVREAFMKLSGLAIAQKRIR